MTERKYVMSDRYDAPKVQMTKLQAEVHEFMRVFLRDNDQMPPARVIQQHFGWASQHSAECHLAALERKGFLERNAVGKFKFARMHPGYAIKVVRHD